MFRMISISLPSGARSARLLVESGEAPKSPKSLALTMRLNSEMRDQKILQENFSVSLLPLMHQHKLICIKLAAISIN